MKLIELIRNKYFQMYFFLYFITMFLLNYYENYQLDEVVGVTIIFGALFPTLAYWMTNSSKQINPNKPASTSQMFSLGVCLLLVVIFLTLGSQYFLKNIIGNNYSTQIQEIGILIGKLIFFVFIPILIFSQKYAFTIKDFGIDFNFKKWRTKKHYRVLLVFVPLMIIFQLFVGQAAAPIRNGDYSLLQLATMLPVVFIWLIIEVGLVEEFFFRTLIQSRVSSYLNSEVSGIIISAVIFGLAHAPGLYLRGAGVDSPVGSSPSILLAVGYSIVVLSAAGIFLGVIWSRTRNLLLVMLIHASVDLLTNFSSFNQVWNSTH